MAWNEPGGDNRDPWGNRNDKGPPDLDEVLRKFQSRLSALFGKGGRSSGGGGGGGGKMSAMSGSLIAIIVLLILAYSSFYTIEAPERGVVLRFGKYQRTSTPGLNFLIPWPVERVLKVNVDQNRSHRLASQAMLTQDENIVDIDLAVQYNIKSAEDYLFNVRGPDRTLEEVVESALREVVGSTVLESVLTTGRDVVWKTTLDHLPAVLDTYEAGIFITAVNLERAQPPEEVQEAFSDAIKAREDKERFVNEAQAYSNEVLPRARGDAQRALEESEAYKSRVVQAAVGESERFLSLLGEYSKAPEVTRERLYLEAMETVFSRTNKVLMDGGDGNSLMYLPIDQLVNQPRDNENAAALGGDSPLNSGSNDSPRFSDMPNEINLPSRDDLRSRDRGTAR